MEQTEKKKVNLYFNGMQNTRLIMSVEQSIMQKLDRSIRK